MTALQCGSRAGARRALRTGARRAATALAFTGVTLLGLWGAGPARAVEPPAETATPGRTPRPVIERASGGACVADPAFMRRNHMNLLKHQRDETVHLGVREARASLKACVSCHASPQTRSVATAKTDFCVSCHSYAAVKIDCFECHASKPQLGSLPPLRQPQAGAADTRLATQARALAAQGGGRP